MLKKLRFDLLLKHENNIENVFLFSENEEHFLSIKE
jgi:hypothetical protein